MSRNIFTIGIDLGGTKVSVALVNQRGKIFSFAKELSLKKPRDLVAQIARLILKVSAGIDSKNIKGIGFASAGPLNVKSGKLIYPTNFPGWKIVPIISLLKNKLAQAKFRKPIYFQNDAMAAALGEGWMGASRQCQTFVVITVGTGIGTGVIFNGKPLQYNGMGGEWGVQLIQHLQVLRQGDPYFASVEGIASGTGILKRAKEQGFTGASIEELSQEIALSSPKFLALFDEAAIALAILCYNLSLGLHPEKILFTGGVMNVEKYFFAKVQKSYAQLIGAHPLFKTSIGKAKLGNKAGVIGAARLPLLTSDSF